MLYLITLLSIAQYPLTEKDTICVLYQAFDVQVQYVDFTSFNNQASLFAFPALPPEVARFSIHYGLQDGDMIYDFSLRLGVTSDESTGPSTTRYDSYGLGLRTLYDIVPGGRWVAGPYADVSLAAEKIILSRKREATSLLDAFDNEYYRISRFNFPLGLGLRVQRTFYSLRNGNPILILGINGQYTIDTMAWLFDDVIPVQLGISMAGFSAGLRIGIPVGGE